MKMTRKLLALALVLAMVLTLSVFAFAAEDQVYVLDALDLETFEKGAKADGDTQVAGNDDYFTIYYSEKSKVEPNTKTFEDDRECTQRLAFGGKTAIGNTIKNCIRFTTSGPATIKIWWVQNGEGTEDNPTRQVGIYSTEGEVITQSNVEGVAKNDPCLSTLQITEAGTYYIGNVIDQNNFYRIEVIEPAPQTPVEPGTPSTGDEIGMIFALLAVSAAALVVLNKKRAF